MNRGAFNTALELRTFGYSVVPSGGGPERKYPIVGWLEFEDRCATVEELESWQRELLPSLWGIVTGEISGVVVVDADSAEARAELEAEIGQEHVETPRGGGHWWFKHPGHPVKTVAGLLPGVDVRGDGGFVNIAGASVYGEYRILTLPSPDTLIPWSRLPERIRAALDGSKPAPRAETGEGGPEGRIPKGKRNQRLASVAGTLRRQGVSQGAIEAALIAVNNAQCDPPLPESDVLRIAKSIAQYAPEPDAHLTEIVITGRHLRDITEDALKALYQANDPPHIFRRSSALTRIGADEKGRPFTETLTEAALRGKLARAANFVHLSEKGGAVAMTPPLDVTRDIESLGRWDFPPLQGITESPVFRRDSTVLTEPGYDAPTGLYYAPAPGMRVPSIPDAPAECELKAAIELVIEVLCDFPFDSEASRANAYGALIAPVVRPAIEGPVPLPIIDKPQPGCGASLIVDTISLIATGHLAATMGVPQYEEEWEKKLSSHLLAGRSLCAVDNIEGKLHSDTLSRYLTSTYVSIRPLGRSADIILPNNMTFIATGDNIRLGGDMPRRCYWIRLDAGVARPWLREVTFKHPELREWIAANRGAILAAMLTIARAWITAGRPTPEGLPILGGFENYCRTIGGILNFMGLKGFMTNLMEMYDKMDADTPQWEGFLEMWSEAIGDAPVTVVELIKHLNESGDLAATLPDSLATKDGRDYSCRLGNALARRNEVHLPNGLIVKKTGQKKHAITWAVVSSACANSPTFRYKGELGEICGGEYAEKGKKPSTSLHNPPRDDKSPVDESHCAVCGADVWVFDPDGRPLCEKHAPPEVD